MKLYTITILLLLAISSNALGQQAPPDPSAKEHFDRGISLLRERKYSEALAAFRVSARLEPEQPSTQVNIGTALLALDRPEEAVAAYRDAVRLAPSEGAYRTSLCTALSMTNRHSEAVKECEEGVRLSPGSDRATGELLNALRAAGRPLAEIMRLADMAVARFRESEALLAFSAEIYYEAGEYVQSAELLRQLIALKPDASIYHGLLADVSLKLERDEEALTEARIALKLEPANPYANYSMGLIFFELGQHEEATESFGKVSPGIPRLRRAEFYRALSEEGRGRPSEAIKILESLVSRFPDDFEFQYQLGSSLNGASRYEDAVGPLTKARQLRPKSLEAVAGLGLALFESGQLDRAVPVLEEALRISPGNEVVTMFLNVTRSRQTLIPQIDELKRFAKENPQHVDVRRTLIQAFSFSRRIDEAEPYLKELLALGPKDPKVYSYVGVAYSTAGRLDKAMEVHLKSLEVGDNPGAYLNLASIYSKRGNFEQAAAAYRKLLVLQPNSPDTMVIFGTLLMENGKRREALDLFKRSIAIKPTNGAAIFKAGILSAKLGESDSAMQYLEMLWPIRPDLARTLGRCLRLRIW